MAANLYARSIFGEDALANVSIEKPSDQSGPSVTGHVRIRAKSQVRTIFLITIICLVISSHAWDEAFYNNLRTLISLVDILFYINPYTPKSYLKGKFPYVSGTISKSGGEKKKKY